MPFEALLQEVEHLHGVCSRLEGLADQHSAVTSELMVIANSVRDIAVILAVLVATRNPKVS